MQIQKACGMDEATELEKIEKLKKSLTSSCCIHSYSSETQDNRIQIEKWDMMGKAKKVNFQTIFAAL